MTLRAPLCASCGTGSCTEEEGLEPKHRNCNSTCPAATCVSRQCILTDLPSWRRYKKLGKEQVQGSWNITPRFHLLQISTVAEMLQRSTSCINAAPKPWKSHKPKITCQRKLSRLQLWGLAPRWWNCFNSQLASVQPVRMSQCSHVRNTITIVLIAERRSHCALRFSCQFCVTGASGG